MWSEYAVTMVGYSGHRYATVCPSTQRLCVLGLCYLCGCGRVGVALSADESDGDDDQQIDRDPVSELDAAAPSEPAPGALDAALDAAGEPVPNTLLGPSPDAGEARDAGVSEAGTGDGGALPEACAGTRSLDLCWYLGAVGASCVQTCARHGGYDPAMADAVGSAAQGGSVDGCDEVMAALGHAGVVLSGYRSDSFGLGCHLWGSELWWLSRPDFSPSSGTSPARVACACQR